MQGEASGILKKGGIIVEGTGGNTGISLAQLGRSLSLCRQRFCPLHFKEIVNTS